MRDYGEEFRRYWQDETGDSAPSFLAPVEEVRHVNCRCAMIRENTLPATPLLVAELMRFSRVKPEGLGG